MGKKRSNSPKRIIETLMANSDKFTSNFEENKEIVRKITNLNKNMRNRVAGYITRIKSKTSNSY
jgi:ribosomal protein S17E